jgi:hypothetical protein
MSALDPFLPLAGSDTTAFMNWRAATIVAVGGLALILIAMFYSGMFMHGD